MKFILVESLYDEDKEEETWADKEISDTYDKIVEAELSELNKWLDKYGFEVELVTDEDTIEYAQEEMDSENYVGMFLSDMQDDASTFPIVLNKPYILKECDGDVSEITYAIRGTLWHEAGHGIFRYLEDVYDLDDLDEEEVVEEFARLQGDGAVEDSELFNILAQYLEEN